MTYHESGIEQLSREIKKAARFVAFQWPGVLEADDAEQTITLHLLESPGSISKILDMDDRARYRAVVGIGNQLASQERADYDHYKGSYRYSVNEVKDVLRSGFLLEDTPSRFSDIGLDLVESLGAIKTEYAQAIYGRYVEDQLVDHNHLNRGLTALTDDMNRRHKRRFAQRDEGPGTRQSLTIGQSQNALQFDWDGEGTEFEQ